MGTILDRGYVRKQGQALVPEFLAFAVVNLLERHFPQLVDYEFTARMEDDLDEIAGGDESRTGWLRRFYFGSDSDGDDGLKALVELHLGDIDAREVNTVPIPRSDIVVRVGKYGPYLERGSERQTLAPDIAPDELTPERAEEILAQGSQERELGADPETKRAIVVRTGRYGPYVTEVAGGRREAAYRLAAARDEPGDGDPRRCAAPADAAAHARLTDGEDVIVANGRYGPYVRRAKESRSLETEEEMFTITLEEALAKLAEPRTRGRRAAAPPLRELGEDPVSKQAGDRQGGPVRPVRHGRRDECEPAGFGFGRDDHARSAPPSCSRPAGSAGPVKKRTTKKRS